MSHPEAPTLCWCFHLDILNHNMVYTFDTYCSPINIGQLRIASPHEQHRIANYSTTVPLSVLQRFLNCIYMSHNIDLIASLKSIGTFDPQPNRSLALRLFRLSPQPLRFIIRPAFDTKSHCHKHGRLWRNRQLICRRPSSKWGPQTHP